MTNPQESQAERATLGMQATAVCGKGEHPFTAVLQQVEPVVCAPTGRSCIQYAQSTEFERSLLLAFLALQGLGQDASRATHDAIAIITKTLRSYVRTILLSSAVSNADFLSDDIVQQVWVRFLTFNLAERFDDTRSAHRAPFLFGIVRNVIRENLRNIKRTRELELIDRAATAGFDPVECAALKELQSDVRAALRSLDPKLSEVLWDRYWSTRRATMTAATRYGREHRGRRNLRPLLASHANS